MRIYRYAVLPIALKVALFFPGMSVNAIAASPCKTTISEDRTEPCNLSNGENLTIDKGVSIDIPLGPPEQSYKYGLKYNAVNVGGSNNMAPVTSVDHIENNGILKGESGVTVTYSGSVEKLLNHGTISGVNGAIWVSGHMKMLDNYGSIKSIGDDPKKLLNSIMIQQAFDSINNGQYGRVNTILNQKEGSIYGISVTTAVLETLDNYGILSQRSISNHTHSTFTIESGSNAGTFNNYGIVTGSKAIVINKGGYLENLNNQFGSKGITADEDAIQVTGQGMASLDVNSPIRPSKIKQITNASSIRGKRNGIYIDDKGVIDTITNLDTGVIQGDQHALYNAGTITNGIHNFGSITGNVELESASLYLYGPKAILKGDVSGTKDSVVTIGGNRSTAENLDLTYTHDMNVGIVKILSGSKLRLGDGHTSGKISNNIDNEGDLYFNRSDNTTISALNNSGRVVVGGDNNAVGRMLTITRDYSGNNGTVVLSTVLGGDNSKTDRLVLKGSTSGTTHLVINNVGGTGAPTDKGIKVVDMQGASGGNFRLVGDYSYKGDPTIVAGAYAYRLYKNGTDNSDENWYLRSSSGGSKPAYQAGVSVYEAYGRMLQILNAPESLRDRTGGRKDRVLGIGEFRSPAGEDSTDDSTSQIPNGVWGRMTATYGKLSPRVSTSDADATTYNMFRAQVGMDKRFYENNQGSVTGGIFLQYSNIDANAGSVHGEGNIRANGYTLGTTSTWYGKNKFYLDGLAQMTYFDNDLNSKTAGRSLGNGKSALGYALSLEAGQEFDLNQAWSLTPQAQLVFSSINMNGFHDPFGAKIHFDRSESLKFRVGTTIDYRQKATHLYGFFNINQEVLGRNDLTNVADVAFISGNDRTWGDGGAGGSYSWDNGKSFVYGQASANTSLNNFADSYELKAKIGIKTTW
ncbi:autotransporter outer membrane beta-barrel domain-containing protein [Xenorhabdus sp. XENO-7]|uniref:Autotransporter outer membrane beta-barrel domain-containing protein n=1 Tax=Xenorhabdus aichiensis TaxID=3025874 RepID=A0ABT5LZ33_9GAMM|nr:autotransporter outer membrane beta-barrel domain-containing protein [Xenorhabdus aichiensis]MDC9620699.1 autotransporter outer membrane beta-barrel domain-containing protein [Xenorhabdus aichiensis]